MIDIINNEENFVNIPLRDFESRALDNIDRLVWYSIQKQPFRGILRERCSEKFANFTERHLSWGFFFK